MTASPRGPASRQLTRRQLGLQRVPHRLWRRGIRRRTDSGMPFVAALALFDLRIVAKRFDVIAQFDERAKRGDARNLALHDLPDLVLLEPVAPDVVDLLDAQRHPAVLRIDLHHFGGAVFALLE